jgi:hypothetical protein
MITRDHPEWPEFRRKIIDEPIEELRSRLEDVNLTAEQTAGIRGHIAALRSIAEEIEPDVPEEVPGRTYR